MSCHRVHPVLNKLDVGNVVRVRAYLICVTVVLGIICRMITYGETAMIRFLRVCLCAILPTDYSATCYKILAKCIRVFSSTGVQSAESIPSYTDLLYCSNLRGNDDKVRANLHSNKMKAPQINALASIYQYLREHVPRHYPRPEPTFFRSQTECNWMASNDSSAAAALDRSSRGPYSTTWY